MLLAPKIEGSATIRATSAEFAEALRARTSAGLLAGQRHVDEERTDER